MRSPEELPGAVRDGAEPPAPVGPGVRAARVVLVAVGVGMLALGVLGFVLDADDTGPVASWVTLAAFAVAHDALFAPAVLLLATLVGRLVPAPALPVVRTALLVSGALALVALPLVLGLGQRPSNPSALPLDYGRGLLTSLAVVWGVTAVVLLVAHAWREASSPSRRRPR